MIAFWSAVGCSDSGNGGRPKIEKVWPGGRLSRRKNPLAAPAACTPGSWRTRSINSCKRTCGRVAVGRTQVVNPETEKSSSAVNRCSARKPRSAASSRAKLCSISPAPTSSTVASAVSATTNQRRVCPAETPADAPPLPSFSVSYQSGRELCQAGASPNITAVSSATPAVKHRAVPSIDTSASRGMLPGLAARNAFRPQ